MAKRVSVDKWLFTVTLLLVFAGLVMVFSASAVMAKENPHYHSAYYFLLRQLFWACAGLGVMVILMNVDYRRYRTPVVVSPLLGMTVLLLLSVFFLDRSHNTHRWFRAGPLSFQPSELAKLALILFLAWFLEQKTKVIQEWRTLVAPGLVTLVLAALIAAQPDLGTALACAAIAGTMLFVAGVRLQYYLYPLACTPVLFYFLVWRVRWRRERILAFLNPFEDPQGRGFHIIQSLIAVGTGGLTGVGLMEGKQKLFYLPEPHTDFIYAVTAEEWGLLGSMLIIILFGVFCYRGIRAAVLSRDSFGRFLATGITAMVVIQAFFNISVVLGMLPTKGIPLPFISYGGSSLFVTLAAVGVLLNITQQTD
jgi:cell division protein FtsW